MVEDCTFCKIASGDLASYSLFEDDLVKVFLDVHPTTKGHMLVIPKKHYVNVFDIPKDILERVISVAQKLINKYKASLEADGFNLMHASGKSAQQSVNHFHFHIVPRYKDDGLNMWLHGVPNSTVVVEEIYNKLIS